ncbi:MAG TPA: hypothetical protein VGD98_09065 [Ktedonobacteraceae bacterium]
MSWDLFCKALLKECAPDFVACFVPGAQYVGIRECQLQTLVNGPFAPREIRGDVVLEARRETEHFLLNVEWQSSRDEKMDERLLNYSVELRRLYNLPVLSVVIYIRPVGRVPVAPLVCSLPGSPVRGGSPAIWFDFVSLEICQTSVEEFRALGLDAFFALMLLCKDGGTPAILEEVLQRLLRNKETHCESIAAAFFFASQVLTSEEDRRFLERKYVMLEETLKANWIYQKMISEGLARGLEQGLEQGLERGRLEEVRQNIVDLVEDRFPTLSLWARGQVKSMGDLTSLHRTLRMVGRATTMEEIKAAFPAQH